MRRPPSVFSKLQVQSEYLAYIQTIRKISQREILKIFTRKSQEFWHAAGMDQSGSLVCKIPL